MPTGDHIPPPGHPWNRGEHWDRPTDANSNQQPWLSAIDTIINTSPPEGVNPIDQLDALLGRQAEKYPNPENDHWQR